MSACIHINYLAYEPYQFNLLFYYEQSTGTNSINEQNELKTIIQQEFGKKIKRWKDQCEI